MIDELMAGLEQHDRDAVEVIKTFIDVYNSHDGTGLFSGLARYNMLEQRSVIAAIRAQSIMQFWSILRQKLKCPIPPKKADKIVSNLWAMPDQNKVLRALHEQTAECIMIARMLHDVDKSERKQLAKEQAAIEADLNQLNDEMPI